MWIGGHLDAKSRYGVKDDLDVGSNQRVICDPGIAYDAIPIQDENRPTAHAPETRERLLGRVRDPELLDHLAIEVAQQREREAEGRGECGVGTVALDAQAKHTRAKRSETVVVLTEPTQLLRSDTAKVE